MIGYKHLSVNLLLALVLLAPMVSVCALAKDDAIDVTPTDAVEFGKRIYREGILSSGEPMRGFVQGDIPVVGNQLACGNCHRRSGFGSIEGNVTTPQITGDILYAPLTSRASEFYKLRNAEEKTRPAYTDALLARVIRLGLNSGGRKLDRLMPHYNLSAAEMQHLIAYLKTLNSADSPGVNKTELHLATVMVEGVAQDKKRAMLRVLYEFIRTLNTDTRPRTRRAAHAPWHKKWHYESHRTWKLHVWQLEGPENTWRDQLELMNSRDPVFALVGGIGNDNWQPVHTFCEDNEIPCLFPNINNPVVSSGDYYSIYFSKGLTLEAEVLANYLLKNVAADARGVKKVYQVFSDRHAGQVPATVLKRRLLAHDEYAVHDIKPAQLGSTLSTIDDGATVIFWMDDAEIFGLDFTNVHLDKANVFVSASMIDVNQHASELQARLKNPPYLIYPYNKPAELTRKLKAPQHWMAARKLPVVDLQLQANTFYAVTLLSRVLKHMGSNFSRDYLIERMEHLDKNIVVSPLYPKLVLGPGQRYASTGAYIAKMKADNSLDIVSDWIVP